MGDDDLIFPITVVKDAALFDLLVSRMADNALDSTNKTHRNLITPVFKQLKIADEDRDMLGPDLRHHA